MRLKFCIPCSSGNHGHCAVRNCKCPTCDSKLMKAYELVTRQKRGNKAKGNGNHSKMGYLKHTEKLNTTY